MAHDLARIDNADFAHVDVMDNHFVPNLTFGPQMVERIKATSPVPLDVHLMISDQDRWAPGYAELGAESVTLHVEATTDPVSTARRIRDIGSRVGLALKPATPFSAVREIAHHFDQILVMTVEPGIYIPAGTPGVPRRWWNIGVRIEDDVAVTAGGFELLTDGLPRTPAEIERVMAG